MGQIANKLLDTLSEHQFAYRRSIGAELHVAELVDFAVEALGKRHYVWITSLDVDGAFDAISH